MFKVIKNNLPVYYNESYSKAESYAKKNMCDSIKQINFEFGDEIDLKTVWKKALNS